MMISASPQLRIPTDSKNQFSLHILCSFFHSEQCNEFEEGENNSNRALSRFFYLAVRKGDSAFLANLPLPSHYSNRVRLSLQKPPVARSNVI
ncbi:hypothetical protein NPIL_49741 [Nephila pilipes]|uniref:Uncharacterized protein n=1 Tax=Nephila pilipes TaxID=299642 RepID=A0A8X6N2A4_NEPPI|nr:hypothetical protein NPIL_49741 [Nephila pilipes]